MGREGSAGAAVLVGETLGSLHGPGVPWLFAEPASVSGKPGGIGTGGIRHSAGEQDGSHPSFFPPGAKDCLI